MKNLFTTILILFSLSVFSQSNTGFNPQQIEAFNKTGELHFRFQLEDRELISKLSSVISIDDVKGNEVFAYANELEFVRFLDFGLPFEIIVGPDMNEDDFRMLHNINIDEITSWDFYPTYQAYLDMMAQFAEDYPDLCQVFSIGQSVNGRELMMAKISDNVSVREAEPQFLYTGTMHGDELVGYVLLLRMIDYLLSNYGTDPKVTNLVNNMEIWINPLANPDGTFYGGNNTVLGSRRYNANSVDLNRNYPDPEDGQHPDGNPWQPETLAFMQLAEDNNFVMSANTHSGAEVINYPWDTWAQRAADDDWWIFVGRQYVDTVHLYSPASYLDGFENGITNGYDWYSIAGGRQDYMNYFHYCREVTMELSNVKKLAASQLEAHWDWNYRSLLNYMEQCTYGVSGVVTDLNTGGPIAAKVFIDGHDIDNSFVLAEGEFGFYQRMLDEGDYDITFSAPGYFPETVQNVTIDNYSTVELNVQLSPGTLLADFLASETEIGLGTSINFFDNSYGSPVGWHWQFEGGEPAEAFVKNPSGVKYSIEGDFDVSLTVHNSAGDSSVLSKQNYIHVTNEILMHNGAIEVCSGLFYDSGGKDGNYQDDEDFTLTIAPGVDGAKMMIDFEEFNVENQSSCNYDWLKIFDGPSTSSPIIGTYCGTDSPGQVNATNPDGKLTFQFHSDYSETRPGWKASVYCGMEQTLNMGSGWNGISSVVCPIDTDLEIMFQGIIDDLIILQGDGGVFWPNENVNTLGNWDPTMAYQIKLQDDVQLNIIGTVTTNNRIDISEGWNNLPVLTTCPIAINDLVNGTNTGILFIIEVAGTEIYWPDMGINSLEQLMPGKSYYLKSEGDGSVIFPDCE